MSAIDRLLREQRQAARDTLERLKFKAPTVYRGVKAVMASKGFAGLGGFDFDFADFAKTVIDVKALKEIGEDERKATELEIEAYREKTRAIERQLKLEKDLIAQQQKGVTLAQKAGMVGDSVLDQLLAKPWAVPALIGLAVTLFRSVASRRRGR